MPKPLIVGLTGCIGAGKSTVASFLDEKDITIIKADDIGRGLLNKSSPVAAALVDTFGSNILDDKGNVNRPALATLAFANEEATARLNAITHPPLLAGIREAIASHIGDKIIVVDAALIVEWEKTLAVDIVVFVDAPASQRAARANEKYGPSYEYRERRQLTEAAKRNAADIIIVNDGSLDELKRKTGEMVGVLERFAVGATLDRKPLRI